MWLPSIYEQDGVTMTKVARSELGVVEDGKFTRTYGRTRYQTINLYTNYQFTLNDHHNFTLMGGYQEEDNDYSYMRTLLQACILQTTLIWVWVQVIKW
mgnify:CR=1 FL=1